MPKDPKGNKDFELFEIKNVEIFATGTHNGDEFTSDDLDQIVSSFKLTKDKMKPFLKIGHSEEQSLLRQDELPAAGFVENLRRRGNKLMADFVRVPKKIFDVIRNGLFSRISSELFVNLKLDDRTHPLALKAVAILGGETPAVSSLKDIMDLGFFDAGDILALSKDVETKGYGFDYPFLNKGTTEEYKMTLEELARQNAKLESQVKSFEEENAELQKDLDNKEGQNKEAETKLEEAKAETEEASKKADEANKKLSQIEEEGHKKELEMKVDNLIKEEKLLPVQKPFAMALLSQVKIDSEKKFSIGDKEYESLEDLFFAFLNTGEVEGLNMGQKSVKGTVRGDEDEFIKRAQKHASEHKMSIKDAIIELSPGR